MPGFEATEASHLIDPEAWPHGTRRLRPPAPIVVAPLAVSQLNVEAVAGINARRYLNWLASHPEVPRARIGRLAIVEASVLLAHLGDLAHARTIAANAVPRFPRRPTTIMN